MTRNFWNSRTLDSFARHIAPVLNDIAEEDESRTYGNRVYDMSFTSEGKDALESFYAETCGELSDKDITYLEAVCKEANDDYNYWDAQADEAREQETEGDWDREKERDNEAEEYDTRAQEALDKAQEEIFEWVLGESSYIELDEGCATDAGEYRRIYIYLDALLWKEERGKDRLSETACDIIESATHDWKNAQDYCSC